MQTGSLKEKYFKEIRGKLMKSLEKGNIFEVPKLEKIVINTSFGRMSPDQKTKEQIAVSLATITGQKPIFTKAKKAIAGFKIREGQVIGAKVTLRNEKMYNFFKKLVSIVFPRLRDFRGVSTQSFDKSGNYSVGFSELSIFPEIDYVKGQKTVGLEVTIATSALNKEDAKKLLEELGMAFTDSLPVEKKQVSEGVKGK